MQICNAAWKYETLHANMICCMQIRECWILHHLDNHNYYRTLLNKTISMSNWSLNTYRNIVFVKTNDSITCCKIIYNLLVHSLINVISESNPVCIKFKYKVVKPVVARTLNGHFFPAQYIYGLKKILVSNDLTTICISIFQIACSNLLKCCV